MNDWFTLFATYRAAVIRNDEVVQGVLPPGMDADHPQVRAALASWEGTYFVQRAPYGVELTLVRPLAPRPRERWWLHALLALATLFTTTVAGAYFVGREPLALAWISLGPLGAPVPIRLFPGELWPGLAFSVPLLAILLGHESGHYLVARRHGMDVSPPYFIPSPQWLNLIGTFGAFIRLRSAMINRAMLLDVGAAGPLISFFLALPAVVVGLSASQAMPLPDGNAPAPFLVLFAGQPIWLGGSVLFSALARTVIGGEGAILLHPLAFAGWLGLFVTALNLFPLSQLDGGHILYALVGRWQRPVGTAFLGVLLLLGFSWWGWWLWAGLILVLGKGTIRHPAVFDPDFRVIGLRRRVGWFCIVIFILTFTPVPIQV